MKLLFGYFGKKHNNALRSDYDFFNSVEATGKAVYEMQKL